MKLNAKTIVQIAVIAAIVNVATGHLASARAAH